MQLPKSFDGRLAVIRVGGAPHPAKRQRRERQQSGLATYDAPDRHDRYIPRRREDDGIDAATFFRAMRSAHDKLEGPMHIVLDEITAAERALHLVLKDR